MKTSRNAFALCALVMVFLVTACSTAPEGSTVRDKAGGRQGQVVLRLANTAYGPGDDLAHFVQQVEKNSGGRMRVSLVNQFGGWAPDAQSQEIRAVATGKVDLGWVGSQGFDEGGISSLTALSAPMLIDSLRVENAVLASRTGHAMLAGVRSSGVTGLAAVSGYIQLPIGVHRALIEPGRWQGIVFATYASQVAEQSIRALGAKPVEAFGPLRSHALSVHAIAGFALAVPGLVNLDLVSSAPYVAVNVPLWPVVAVAIANPAKLSSLTEQQRRWVQDAATQTADSFRRSDADVDPFVSNACSRGASLVAATPAQIGAFRHAFAGIYADLDKDRRTQAYISQIRQLKASLPPPGPLPRCGSHRSGS